MRPFVWRTGRALTGQSGHCKRPRLRNMPPPLRTDLSHTAPTGGNMVVPVFKENERRLTLGVEMEFQVLDAVTGMLTPRALELLQLIDDPRIEKEFFMSTLEIVTGVCNDMHE